MTHEHATIAEEEYLQTIYWLMEAGLPITGANVARAMHLSPPTVHEMVGRLEQDGYIRRADDKSLEFSPEGKKHAEAIVRRHRLIERFLTDVVGVAWDDVHEEAEKLEHAMSPVFEGAADAVDAMVEFVRRGPGHAEVSAVDVADETPEGLTGFAIK